MGGLLREVVDGRVVVVGAFLGAGGSAPALEGGLSASGGVAAGAVRDAGGGGGFRRSGPLGALQADVSAPVSALRAGGAEPRHAERRDRGARSGAVQDRLRRLGRGLAGKHSPRAAARYLSGGERGGG